MTFYYLECHYGDDNDNNIRDVVIEAPNEETLFAYLRTDSLETCGTHADVDWSGDDSILCFYTGGDACPEGSNCSDRDCDADHRLFHRDFYLKSKHETEEGADSERQRYHGQSALIRLDTQGNVIETCGVKR